MSDIPTAEVTCVFQISLESDYLSNTVKVTYKILLHKHCDKHQSGVW